jgi:hypothetical protein
MTSHAIPAWHKGQDKDMAVQGTWKGQTFRARRQEKPESITGIRNQGSRHRLCLGSRTLNKTFRKTADKEVAKQTVQLPSDCRK